MSRRTQPSDTRSRTLGDYSVGEDSRTCTVSSDGVGQPRKKKFVSPKCYCGSNAILFQSCTKLNPDKFFLGCPHYNTTQQHCKYFYWLDMLVEENTEGWSTGRKTIFMVRRLKELEQRVEELDMELNLKMHTDVRGVQDNKCLYMAIVGFMNIILVLALKGLF
ncbi:hypothetical protein PIB30_042241 [Stylosanthes scabra]|uniref:Zinc finger GRF-type domain-containing protein n=1 Tax=Stylosanthes scabra TaxID=79078 RepID=A0ABU6ZDY9_9FABA|nr:hypothetical protein [Stylosanthes scabra]